MNLDNVKDIMKEVSRVMDENKDYLVELDSKAGDGDLGISMSSGFRAVLESDAMEKQTLKKFFMASGMVINEASPSSLGTIIFMGMIAGAKNVGDAESLDAVGIGNFFMAAAQSVMDKTGSKTGEKTILDSVVPAAKALMNSDSELITSMKMAYEVANEGMLSTIKMQAVHGRAAYYQEKSIGFQDGGATVGMLIFRAISDYLATL
ncbi:MAG: DAK2 domain-containing protein [Clostridiales bacterium]|nr:DAK2 domain-containing protein [Clostridiales bacterium]